MNTETQNYETERKILDSGNRREFESGAVRDVQLGKGRCDLLPLNEVASYLMYLTQSMVEGEAKNRAEMAWPIIDSIGLFLKDGVSATLIYNAIIKFADCLGTKYFPGELIMELSKHYEEGAKKYAERNWEKGIPLHCYIDSGVRHLLKWIDGREDEPHDRAFLWNMFGLLWTYNNKPECNDLPYTAKEETTNE